MNIVRKIAAVGMAAVLSMTVPVNAMEQTQEQAEEEQFSQEESFDTRLAGCWAVIKEENRGDIKLNASILQILPDGRASGIIRLQDVSFQDYINYGIESPKITAQEGALDLSELISGMKQVLQQKGLRADFDLPSELTVTYEFADEDPTGSEQYLILHFTGSQKEIFTTRKMDTVVTFKRRYMLSYVNALLIGDWMDSYENQWNIRWSSKDDGVTISLTDNAGNLHEQTGFTFDERGPMIRFQFNDVETPLYTLVSFSKNQIIMEDEHRETFIMTRIES